MPSISNIFAIESTRTRVIEHLSATDLATVCYAIGYKLPQNQQDYLDVIRDLQEQQVWIRSRISEGRIVKLIGKDVPTMLDRIMRPEVYWSTRVRHEIITIWMTCMDPLRDAISVTQRLDQIHRQLKETHKKDRETKRELIATMDCLHERQSAWTDLPGHNIEHDVADRQLELCEILPWSKDTYIMNGTRWFENSSNNMTLIMRGHGGRFQIWTPTSLISPAMQTFVLEMRAAAVGISGTVRQVEPMTIYQAYRDTSEASHILRCTATKFLLV